MTPTTPDALKPTTLSKALALIQRLASQIRGLGRAPDIGVQVPDLKAVFPSEGHQVAATTASNHEVARLKAELAAERTAHATTKATLAAASATEGKVFAALKRIGIRVDASTGDLNEAVREAVAAHVASAAADCLASTGVPVSGLPPQSSSDDFGAADELAAVRRQIEDERLKQNPDSRKLGQLADRANALRERA